jgi:hypothetical protein
MRWASSAWWCVIALVVSLLSLCCCAPRRIGNPSHSAGITWIERNQSRSNGKLLYNEVATTFNEVWFFWNISNEKVCVSRSCLPQLCVTNANNLWRSKMSSATPYTHDNEEFATSLRGIQEYWIREGYKNWISPDVIGSEGTLFCIYHVCLKNSDLLNILC